MREDLQWIVGKKIKAIYLNRDEDYNNSIISISIKIDDQILGLTVDGNTETIMVNTLINPMGELKKEILFDDLFIDKQIVSYWFPENNLGYNDTFILGLDKFVPTHVFSTAASCIRVGTINYF